LKKGNRTIKDTCSREGKTRGRIVVERMNIKSFFDFPQELEVVSCEVADKVIT